MVTENHYTELELMQARVEFVPNGWAFFSIRDAFTIKNNLRKPISEEERSKNPGPYPYFGPTKIQGYIGTYEQEGSYALIGEDGDHFLKYRHQSMTQLVEGKCTVNNHAHIIEGSDVASREWFYHYFMHRDIFSFLSRQGAGRYKLNKASLEKIPLLVPPLPEQKKIAQILSTWDQAITATERLLENSQQRKKALMQQLLTGKKRLPGFEGEWAAEKLKSLCAIKTGKKDVNEGNPEGAYPFFTCASEPTGSDDYSYDCEALLIAGNGIIGKTHHFKGKFEAYQRTYILHDFTSRIAVFYLHQFILYWLMRDIDREKQHGAMPYIKLGLLQNFRVFLPALKEQLAIADALTTADTEIFAVQRRLSSLKQEKKALMQQLLTGKRRVKVDAEVA
jgi:type I restriction enzyme S subunit